jgi:hypothetical protein
MDDVSPAPPPPTIKAGTSTAKLLVNLKVIPVWLMEDRLIADFGSLEKLLAHGDKFAFAHCALSRSATTYVYKLAKMSILWLHGAERNH